MVLVLLHALLLLDPTSESAIEVACVLRDEPSTPSPGAASSNIDGVLRPDSNDLAGAGLEQKALAI